MPILQSVVQQACFLLSNLLRGPGANPLPFLEAGVLPLLVAALTTFGNHSSVVAEVFWVLVYCTANNQQAASLLA